MKVLAETVPADLASIRRLRSAVRHALAAHGATARATNDLQLVVAELATNIVDHGDPPATTLALELAIEERDFVLTLTDDGGAFDGFAARLAAPSWPEEPTLGEHGLGFKLVREMVSELRYEPGPPNRMRARYPWAGSATSGA